MRPLSPRGLLVYLAQPIFTQGRLSHCETKTLAKPHHLLRVACHLIVDLLDPSPCLLPCSRREFCRFVSPFLLASLACFYYWLSFILITARKASWGKFTFPMAFMRFFPLACFCSNFFFRCISDTNSQRNERTKHFEMTQQQDQVRIRTVISPP